VLQDQGVPHRVQVAALAAIAGLEIVGAAIVAIAGMEGLVHVADEVHDEFECLHAVRAWLRPISEHAQLIVDRGDDAIAVAAIT
jgi:hypothetical protein